MKSRVLVIEDEDELRELICEFLTFQGIQAVPSIHGEHALITMEKELDFDLILTDWNMPVMGGKRFLELAPKIPTLVLSANRPSLPDHCVYLEKPFLMEELLFLIRQNLKTE